MNNIQNIISGSISKEKERGTFYLDDSLGEHFLSYSEQYEEAGKILTLLQDTYKLEKGNKLIILIKDKRFMISTLWACFLGGIVAVPLEASGTPQEIDRFINVWNELGNCYVISCENEINELNKYFDVHNLDTNILLDKEIVFEPQNLPDSNWKEVEISSADAMVILFSSGTTGNPKGVILDYNSVYEGTNSLKRALILTDTEIVTSWLPLSHSFGLVTLHMLAVVSNYTQVIFSKDLFAYNPLTLLDFISKYRVSVTGLPNFAFQSILNEIKEDNYSWDLSSLKCIINSAEPINYDVCVEFSKRLQKYNFAKKAVCPMFGMSEVAGGIVISNQLNNLELVGNDGKKVIPLQSNQSIDKNNSCLIGKSLDACELRITSDAGEILSENHIGNIEVFGKNVFKGYYNPQHTQEAFTKDGWFRTGDVGAIIDNQLTIVGRKKEVIIINGKKIYPNDVENYIQDCSLANSKDVAVCGVKISSESSNEVITVFVKYEESKESFVELAKQIRIKLSEYGIPQKCTVIPVDNIPKTASGKKSRNKLKTKFENGEYTEICEWLESQNSRPITNSEQEHSITPVEQELLNIWESILDLKELSIYDHFFEIGGNSVTVLKMVLEAKSRKIIFKASDVHKYPTIYELCKIADVSEFSNETVVSDFSFSKDITYNVIDTVVSNDDIFSWDELNCFWRAAMIAVRSNGVHYDKAFLLMLLFYQTYQIDGYFSTPFWKNRDEEYERFFNSVIFDQLKLNISRINNINTKEELMAQIVHSVDSNKPLIITGDLFTIFYTHNYKEVPHFHYFIIKGYDTVKDIVYIVDNMQLDNGSSTVYKDFTIKLDDLFETMMYVKSNMTEDNEQQLIWEYRKNSMVFLNLERLLIEHSNLLKEIVAGTKSVNYLEEKIFYLSKENNISEFELNYFNILMNQKRTYFKLLASIMRSCSLPEEEIKELEYLQKEISNLWKPVRISILDNVMGAEVDVTEIEEKIVVAKEYETKYRDKLIKLLSSINEESNQNTQNKAEKFLIKNEFSIINPIDAKIEISNDEVQFYLDKENRYDFWIQIKNAPRLIRNVYSDEWKFSATIENMNKYHDRKYHDGILIEFENGYHLLFGSYCEVHNQANISIYCPEAGEDCRLYSSKNFVNNLEALRVNRSDNTLYF